ncbi:MAG: mechanosensitive ion channel family protein [Syntrophomonadaceae bacterium]|nr:mechanosensitive ion channel family protein [Syntrophomonadaceae bacterium]
MEWDNIKLLLDQYLTHPDIWWLETLYALLIFLVFVLLRNTVVSLIYFMVHRLAQKSPVMIVDRIIRAYEKPIKNLVLVIGAYVALDYLTFTATLDEFILKLFRSLVIVFLFSGLYRCLNDEVLMRDRLQDHMGMDQLLTGFLTKIFKFIIIALAFLVVVSEWGYDVNGFIAGLGLGGLAIALAAQSALADLIGGAGIIMEKPYAIGDWVQTPSVDGIVEDISFRRTTFRTLSQDLVTVPNATIATEAIKNLSRKEKRLLELRIGVTYNTTAGQLEQCVRRIHAMLRENQGIHQEQIVVNFEKFNDSSLDILVWCYTKEKNLAAYSAVREDVNYRIMAILKEEGVSAAFPSHSIYMEHGAQIGRPEKNEEAL